MNPKNKKSRYHRVILHGGLILEIGWDFQRQMYRTTVWNPRDEEIASDPTDPRYWDPVEKFWGVTRRDVLSGVRAKIAAMANPDVDKVTRRMKGEKSFEERGAFTLEMMKKLKERMEQDQVQVSSPRKYYVSPNVAKQLEGLQGLHPDIVVIDEKLSDRSIFMSDGNGAHYSVTPVFGANADKNTGEDDK